MLDALLSLLAWPWLVGGLILGIVGALIVERFYPGSHFVQMFVFFLCFVSGLGIELWQAPKAGKPQ